MGIVNRLTDTVDASKGSIGPFVAHIYHKYLPWCLTFGFTTCVHTYTLVYSQQFFTPPAEHDFGRESSTQSLH